VRSQGLPGFAGMADDVTDEEVIIAIQSVPCHY
jgi:hypothetical protein